MSWATAVEASAITGLNITSSQITTAQAILEIWVGEVDTTRMENVKTRDVNLLKKAVSYQAAWMQSKPELFGRSDVDQVIQDSLQFSKGDQETHVLAPLAKASIMKLSWRRARTIDPLTPEQALAIRRKTTAETYGMNRHGPIETDEIYPWEPM